ncbi:uncharacterized protein [Miscanthus floridulus]|uniref:uncharacterized protein n=1 Tax=Miscanthus floridulus TaxID=154761 RepID=UPI0034594F84
MPPTICTGLNAKRGLPPVIPIRISTLTRLKPQPGPRPTARQRHHCPMSLPVALANGYGPPPPPLRDPAGRGPPSPNALRSSARGPDPAAGEPNLPPPEPIAEAAPIVDGEQQPHLPPPRASLRPRQPAGRGTRPRARAAASTDHGREQPSWTHRPGRRRHASTLPDARSARAGRHRHADNLPNVDQDKASPDPCTLELEPIAGGCLAQEFLRERERGGGGGGGGGGERDPAATILALHRPPASSSGGGQAVERTWGGASGGG